MKIYSASRFRVPYPAVINKVGPFVLLPFDGVFFNCPHCRMSFSDLECSISLLYGIKLLLYCKKFSFYWESYCNCVEWGSGWLVLGSGWGVIVRIRLCENSCLILFSFPFNLTCLHQKLILNSYGLWVDFSIPLPLDPPTIYKHVLP